MITIQNEKSKRNNPLKLWIWITKALVLREHDLAKMFLEKLTDWLDDSDLSTICSHGFYTILSEDSWVLNKKTTNAFVKLFYRQHFFVSIIDNLKQKFNSVDLKQTGN